MIIQLKAKEYFEGYSAKFKGSAFKREDSLKTLLMKISLVYVFCTGKSNTLNILNRTKFVREIQGFIIFGGDSWIFRNGYQNSREQPMRSYEV